MKCPKCNSGNCKYIIPLLKTSKGKSIQRIDFRAKCKCGWEGIL